VDSTDEATIWVEGTLEINTNAVGDVPAGGLALAGEKPLSSVVKAGYDGNADDDLDDAGDNLAVNETFGSTTITPTYDHNGNLTFDGTFKYTYDVWNRLVKVTLDDPDVVIQQARYDGLGRRVRKIVTNAALDTGWWIFGAAEERTR
jgi:hypothetical protein